MSLQMSQDSAPREREVHVEPEQAFLARQLEMLMRDPQRDPRKAFRSVSGQNSRLGSLDDGSGLGAGRGGGVVGPLAGGGLNMPSVDLAMREMEGLQTPVGGRRVSSPISVMTRGLKFCIIVPRPSYIAKRRRDISRSAFQLRKWMNRSNFDTANNSLYNPVPRPHRGPQGPGHPRRQSH